MNASRGKLVGRLLAGALLAIGEGGLAAAPETEPSTGEGEVRNGSAEAKADMTGEEDAATNDNPSESHDVFMPTEEISEDFAVPFPVDI